MFQSTGSVVFQVGQLEIHWYGMLIAAGILLCYWYIMSEAKRRGLSQKPIEDMAFWLILWGILGARLYYIFFNAPYYFANPAQILKIWQGGLAIHGAILGGAAAYAIFTWRRKIPFLLYADLIMPGVLLAQGIGRWGNFFNSEAFGGPTNLPWKLFIAPEFRPEGLEDFLYFHPTFLYESLWNFTGFLFLVFLSRRCHPRLDRGSVDSRFYGNDKLKGAIFFAYLLWYSLGRFFIEGLRTDSLYFGPLRAAQAVSVVLFLTGAVGLIFLWRKRMIKNPSHPSTSSG